MTPQKRQRKNIIIAILLGISQAGTVDFVLWELYRKLWAEVPMLVDQEDLETLQSNALMAQSIFYQGRLVCVLALENVRAAAKDYYEARRN